MSFFQKLKLNIPEQEEEQTPPKRKRGRPRKYPPKEIVSEKAEKKETDEIREPEKQAEGELTIDVYETDSELVIRSPVAGVKPDEINVSIEDDMLIIRGERPAPESEEKAKIVMQECYWGSFSRRFVLPVEVDGKIKASLERGILTIRIPKTDKKRKRKIVVEEVEE